MGDTWNIIWAAIPILNQGALMTLQVATVALLLALVIGLVFGLMRISRNKLLNTVAALYVYLIRGTPLLVQILFIRLALPLMLEIKISEFTAGVAAISVNAGAYLVEIFRAGIQSIDKGQMEAGRSLGLSYGQTMRLIILPQAIRRMIPAFVNQFIVSIKDTSLLSVIGLMELTMQGQSIYAANYRAVEILSAIAVYYLLMITILTLISTWWEKKLARV